MSAVRSNPSFLGLDGVQIDVVFYPRKKSHGAAMPKPVVVINRDESLCRVDICPHDLPRLIESLKSVYEQYREWEDPSNLPASETVQ